MFSSIDNKDAAGFFDSDLSVLKSPGRGTEIVRTDQFTDFSGKLVGKKYVVGHCRAATRGDPKINDNNHPFTDKDGRFCVAHVGMVKSTRWDLTPTGTDSTMFVHAISSYLASNDDDIRDAVLQASRDLFGSRYVPNTIVVGTKEKMFIVSNYIARVRAFRQDKATWMTMNYNFAYFLDVYCDEKVNIGERDDHGIIEFDIKNQTFTVETLERFFKKGSMS